MRTYTRISARRGCGMYTNAHKPAYLVAEVDVELAEQALADVVHEAVDAGEARLRLCVCVCVCVCV
jgi:hypothetical protein